METNQMPQSSSSKVWLWVIVVIIVLAAGGAAWYFFIRKSAEGGSCTSDSKCQSGLKCANKTCSSGKIGSACADKTNCQTNYCVNSKCTDGKKDSTCATYRDCEQGLLCKRGSCSEPPSYSQYFTSVVISKMKPGLPPGPDNPTTVTNAFTTADAIEIDFYGVKPATIGNFYYELVNPESGEVAMTSKDRNPEQQVLQGEDRGTGTSLSGIAAGTYDLNIYFQDILVYTTQITIS